jgi:hypothetical protein
MVVARIYREFFTAAVFFNSLPRLAQTQIRRRLLQCSSWFPPSPECRLPRLRKYELKRIIGRPCPGKNMNNTKLYKDGSRLLIFRQSAAECRALSAYYPGIRFNQIRISFLPPTALRDNPDREEMEITFNISGAPYDLLRHAFADVAWWNGALPSGVTYRCATSGFGRAWRVLRTRKGYSVQRAWYVDGLTKLALALQPPTPRRIRGRDGPVKARPLTASSADANAKRTSR